MSLRRYTFSGSPLEIGRQHGEQCRALIERHLGLLKERFEERGITLQTAAERSLAYREHVRAVWPDFDRELEGLAAGAGITLQEAYLLQLRAEIYAELVGDLEASNECTTFAFEPSATSNGEALIGQNADLPAMYRELLVVVEFRPDNGPAVLMVVPAGQVSYIGINDAGLAAFGNFLTCDGWRTGFPRYLFTRFALAHTDLDSAVEALEALTRASSRNLLLFGDGRAIDLENTPDRMRSLLPERGMLFHSNHYLSEEFAADERSEGERLHNSHVRYERITELAQSAADGISLASVAAIMRDREDPVNAISVEFEDTHDFGEYMTVCGIIAQPELGMLWVSDGPPSQERYAPVAFEGVDVPDALL